MRVLQLCNKPPYPPKDGGCIAMHNITEGLLANDIDVDLLTIYTHKHWVDLDSLPQDYLDQTKIQAVFVDTRVNLVDAFSSLITQDSYNVSRFFSTDVDIKLTRLLRKIKFDVVHLESLFMTPYIATIRRFSKAKIVLRSHNLEYIIWERVADGTKNLAKRGYLKYLSKKLKQYELSVIDQVDGIASISDEDLTRYQNIGLKKPLINIPFGVNVDNYKLASEEPEVALFHLGSLDWTPNLEGVIWFLESIWPSIREKHPELKFYLAGRNIPNDINGEKYPGIIVVGEVKDAHEFMRSKAIMVVPLLSAGGIRVKIIEGMALGKTIISTSIGAEGIRYTDGKDILIADTKEQYLECVDNLLKDPSQISEIGKTARELSEKHFDNRHIVNNLIGFYKSLIEE